MRKATTLELEVGNPFREQMEAVYSRIVRYTIKRYAQEFHHISYEDSDDEVNQFVKDIGEKLYIAIFDERILQEKEEH